MGKHEALFRYVLRLGDNALITGQRLAELVTGAPELEEELAIANFSLDYIGQARLFYSYAGELEGAGRVEDDFAFLRDEREFENVLLVEQPNGHFGDTIVRQFLFESFYALQLDALTHCSAPRLAEIAVRAEKELQYHLRHASQWMLRLGDGTDESHARMQDSLNKLWRYSGEMFAADELDETFRREWQGPHLSAKASVWKDNVAAVLKRATLEVPADQWMDSGGRSGRHSEQFGYLIAEMQYMQRAWPGAQW